MPEFDTEGIFVYFSEDDDIIGFVFFFHTVGIVDEDKVFDGCKLNSASEVKGIGFKSLIPFGSFVSEASWVNNKVRDNRGLEVNQGLFFGEFVSIGVFQEFSIWSGDFDFPGAIHAHKIVFVLDGGHGDSPVGAVHLVFGLNSVIVQVVNGACGVASEFA